mmetsp:Transcript_1415/g.4466  ORF Transcript_1415/g.4466 Transcript_1415/m.4466 type:complete len:305 (-) Transcript_1415:568-1482(-)
MADAQGARAGRPGLQRQLAAAAVARRRPRRLSTHLAQGGAAALGPAARPGPPRRAGPHRNQRRRRPGGAAGLLDADRPLPEARRRQDRLGGRGRRGGRRGAGVVCLLAAPRCRDGRVGGGASRRRRVRAPPPRRAALAVRRFPVARHAQGEPAVRNGRVRLPASRRAIPFRAVAAPRRAASGGAAERGDAASNWRPPRHRLAPQRAPAAARGGGSHQPHSGRAGRRLRRALDTDLRGRAVWRRRRQRPGAVGGGPLRSSLPPRDGRRRVLLAARVARLVAERGSRAPSLARPRRRCELARAGCG